MTTVDRAMSGQQQVIGEATRPGKSHKGASENKLNLTLARKTEQVLKWCLPTHKPAVPCRTLGNVKEPPTNLPEASLSTCCVGSIVVWTQSILPRQMSQLLHDASHQWVHVKEHR